jgi:hypothetical protein
MTGIFHLMEVVMLAPTRISRRFPGQISEQGLIK